MDVLFVWDGGYPTEEGGSCDEHFNRRHEGDNDRAAFVLDSRDGGRTWELEKVLVGEIANPKTLTSKFTWPPNDYGEPFGEFKDFGRELGRLELQNGRRPRIYMSNGKHHMYLHPGDWETAAYSSGKCDDDVDGDADPIDPDLRSVRLPNDRLNNVGEPEVAKVGSLADNFVGSLIHLFPTFRCNQGRHAWSENYFCSNGAFPNAKAWQSSDFDLKP